VGELPHIDSRPVGSASRDSGKYYSQFRLESISGSALAGEVADRFGCGADPILREAFLRKRPFGRQCRPMRDDYRRRNGRARSTRLKKSPR